MEKYRKAYFLQERGWGHQHYHHLLKSIAKNKMENESHSIFAELTNQLPAKNMPPG